MSQSRLAVLKSTVDKWGFDIAVSAFSVASPNTIDLDDRAGVESRLLKSKEDFLVWKILDLSSTQLKGVENFAFMMGIASQSSANNMMPLSIAGQVSESFCVGRTVAIRDYTQVTPPTEDYGYLSITKVDLNPQVSDGLTGYRLIMVGGMFQAKV